MPTTSTTPPPGASCTVPGRGPARSVVPALAAGVLAMGFVGGSVAVSGGLAHAPFLTAQSLRYALACLLLLGVARLRGRPLLRPRGTEWAWLGGVAATGLVIFNLALVLGAEHAEPAVLAVAVAAVPVVLAVAGPAVEGRRPGGAVLLGAVLVTLGAVLVQGVGRADAVGVLWAVVVLVCEVGFTVLALPVLARHGPVGVSVHATWIAAIAFAVLALPIEGPAALLRLTGAELLATGYLAVAVTALAFVLWYSCVQRVGAARAGLLAGVAPAAAAAAGVALGGPAPGVLVWVGLLVVGAGLAVGLSRRG